MNRYEIKDPVWKDNSIGIAEFRLKNDLLIDITYKNKNNERVFPNTYIIKNADLTKKYLLLLDYVDDKMVEGCEKAKKVMNKINK